MSFGGFDAAFGGVRGPVDVEVAGEVPDLLGIRGEPGGQGVGGVVAGVPVAVPVVDDSGLDGGVVAVAQLGEQAGVQRDLVVGLGGLDCGVRVG